jgi:hypothetical protein
LASILTWKVPQLASLVQSRFIHGELTVADQPSPQGYAQAYYQFAKNRGHHYGRGY